MIKKLHFSARTIPAAFLLLCFLSFGLLIPRLGFYWDDWPFTWFAHLFGPAGFTSAFASDRPWLALIYMITTPIIGDSRVGWQIFGILTRCLAVFSAWWMLRQVWPRHTRAVTWAALLLAVFPGFAQQWISVIYSQAFIILAAFFASVGGMLVAARNPRRYWWLTLLCLLLSTFNLISTEYFYGLDLLRPVLLWLAFLPQGEPPRQRARRALFNWLPYLLVWGGYTLWRVQLMQSPGYRGYGVTATQNGLSAFLMQGVKAAAEGLYTSAAQVWTQTLQTLSHSLNLISLLVVAAGVLFSLVFLLKLDLPEEAEAEGGEERADRWALQAAVVGVLAILLGRAPSWAAGLPFRLEFPYDRFTLSTMLGSSLVVTAAIEYLVKTRVRRAVLLSLVIGLAVGQNFQNARAFQRDWEKQADFFWQLTWRIPGLQPNTMLLTDELPVTYYSDNSLSAPLNWIYAPEYRSGDMPYMLVFSSARLGGSLPSLEKNTPVRFEYRALTFNGNTSQSVVIYQPAGGCVRVLDRTYNNDPSFPNLPKPLTGMVALSNPKLILTDASPAARPPQRIFGAEPAHTWCYYLNKAELARQKGDWNTVAALGNEVQTLGYQPVYMEEWIPFIEGYARTGSWKQAAYIAGLVNQKQPRAINGLCAALNRNERSVKDNPAGQQSLNDLRNSLNCPRGD